MSNVPQLFTLYQDTLIFKNGYGQDVDGQAVDTWIATEGASYERAEVDIRRAP